MKRLLYRNMARITALLLVLSIPYAHSSSKLLKQLPITFSGFIQHDIFWDSRQVVSSQEGLGLFYPAPKLPDVNGNDINAQGQFNMLPIYSRLGVAIEGPRIKHAQSRGYIEADFLGKPGIPNILRLRHAYIDLIWNHTALRAGQYWHPIVVPEALPDTVDINTGFPAQQLIRSPQVLFRYAQRHHEIKIAALSQLDFTSPGPMGNSSTYLRNAVVPNLYAEIKGLWEHQFAGIGIDYKRLRPRLESMVSTSTYAVHESVNGVSGILFGAVQYPDWHLYTKFTYGENLDDCSMINGYGVTGINSTTGYRSYAPIRALSWWIDSGVQWSQSLEPGVYVGFTKNIGISSCLARDSSGAVIVYGRAPTLDHVAFIAPRIYWRRNTFKLGAEVVYSHASYGTINNHGTIDNAVPVADVRFHMALYYFF